MQTATPRVERDWWLRVLLVITSPVHVFAWLRDDSDEAASARQEPITAVTFVAGISIFLSTRTAGRLFDEVEFDNLLVVVECVVAGLLIAIQNFWILGGAVYLGAMYEKGKGVAKDQEKAVALYQRACDKGDAAGCANLGEIVGKKKAGAPAIGGSSKSGESSNRSNP